MEDLTPVAACPPEEVPSLSLLPEVSPGPLPGLPPPDRSAQALTPTPVYTVAMRVCGVRKEGTPDKISTGGSGTPPSTRSLGSRKPGFLFLGFRLLAPPKGAGGPQSLGL